MNIMEFLDDMSSVEFSQHFIGELQKENNLATMVRLINSGIKTIHKELMLRKGVAKIQLDNVPKRYKLNDKETYILTEDTPVNLIKILEFYDDSGIRLNINTRKRYGKVPSRNVTLISDAEFYTSNTNTVIEVVFQRHGKLLPVPLANATQYNFPDEEIDIPSYCVDLLSFFICKKLFATTPALSGYAAPYSPSVHYESKYNDELESIRNALGNVDTFGDESESYNSSELP